MQVLLRVVRGEWLIPLVLAAVLLLVMLGGDEVIQWLRYDRLAIAQGQLWRLLTAHLTHLGWSHLLLNLAGLILLWALLGDVLKRGGWLLLLLVSALAVGAGLYLFDPQLRWYVGLSGVLHGVLLGGALLLARFGSREGGYLLLLAVAKLLWEQLIGPMPGSEESAGGKVIVDAHLYGAIAGGLLVLILLSRESWRQRFIADAVSPASR